MTDLIQISGDLDWNCYRKVHGEILHAMKDDGVRRFELDMKGLTRAFPNGVAPLILLLDHVRAGAGAEISVVNGGHPFMLAHDYLAYLDPSAGVEPKRGRSAIHPFHDDHELNHLINHKIDQVLEQAKFAPGVLEAFEWFLNEIAGNVLVHSQASKGWLQVLVHPKTHHLAVIVADSGVGIPASIRAAEHLQQQFGTDLDDGAAIEISLRNGVTSRPDYGQGKGLTGTMSIVKANEGGRLAITSQAGRVFYSPNSIGLKVEGHLPPLHGTLIDVQLDLSKPIEIEKALWGHTPVNFTETVYGKETPVGLMRLPLREQAPSFGNRITATRIRKKIENLLLVAPQDALEIDFDGVSMVASSFADEVFGKLAAELGIIGFSRRLKFINLNRFCQGIIDDVVQARMAQNYGMKNVNQ